MNEARRLLESGKREELVALRQTEAAEVRRAFGLVHPLLLEWRLLALRAKES
jgi:hypothetical protein